MKNELFLYFLPIIILVSQCSIISACATTHQDSQIIEGIVIEYTHEEKGSDGISNFGLAKGDGT